MSSSPDVNGRAYSFGSITLKLDGTTKIVEFKTIKYPFKVEEAMVYDAQGRPTGRTRGKVTLDAGSLAITAKEFRNKIASVQGWLFKAWTLVVSYGDFGMPTHTDTVVGLRFTGGDPGGEEGVDALYLELPFSFLDLKLNGVSVFEYPADAGVT